MNFTFEKRLGCPNVKRAEPIVEAGGEAWVTKGGVIAVYPDQWEGEEILEGYELKVLPDSVKEVVRVTS